MNSDIKIIKEKISLDEFKKIAKEWYGNMVKAVVDVQQRVMAVGGELHSDEESLLLEYGLKQENLWGINIHFDEPRDSWIEFNSMINIRPRQNNRSRNVENEGIRKQIKNIVNDLIS